MKNSPKKATKPIEPAHLGPLTKDAPSFGPAPVLFPGERRWLGKSRIRRRAALWNQVAPVLEPVLTGDEHVLYVAEGVEKVSFLRAMTMGALIYAYHRVVLVLTDRRLIEVLLDMRGKCPESRIRSVPWRALTGMSVSLGRLKLQPTSGKNLVWNLRVRGDRKLVKALIPKIQESGQIGGAASSEALPAVHCSGCGETFREAPDRCRTCGTAVRSRKLARALAVAFPGAGLFYLGHPVLGMLDLLGELMLFVLMGAILLFAPDSAAIAAAAGTGGILLLLTKLESLHVGEVLSGRLRTETTTRRERWRKFSLGGAFTSALALILVVAASGTLAGKVDRDLDFTRAGEEWSFTRGAAESEIFPEDPAVRSEWSHPDGWTVTVFAYPLSPGESFEMVRETFLATQQVASHSSLEEAGDLPAELAGFRATQIEDDGDERLPLAYLNYFVYDEEGKDLHQLVMVVAEEEQEEADKTIRTLLQKASWVETGAP